MALITLDRIADLLTTLDVVCRRCDRQTTLDIPDLVTRYRHRAAVADFFPPLQDGCPKVSVADLAARCHPHAPGLLVLLNGQRL